MSHPIIQQLKRDLADYEMHRRAQDILNLVEATTEGFDLLGQAPLDPNDFPTKFDAPSDDFEFELDAWDDDVVTEVQPYETMSELVFGHR